jgi:hypothetical protein
MGREPARWTRPCTVAAPELRRRSSARPATAYAWLFTKARYGTHPEAAAERARSRILAALDRLEAELGDETTWSGGGSRWPTWTAAALFFPVVLPPEAPRLTGALPASYERFPRIGCATAAAIAGWRTCSAGIAAKTGLRLGPSSWPPLSIVRVTTTVAAALPFRLLSPRATLPTRAHEGDAGLDL